MSDTPFQGMRGAGDFLSNEEIENWRQGILRLFPNGMAPLTAMTALMASEATTNVTYNWNTKTLPTQRAAITGVYTNNTLATPYTTTGNQPIGTTIHIKVATEVEAKRFRPGHQVLIRKSTDHTIDCTAEVKAIALNSANSYITVSLLEADDNGTIVASQNISDCDTLLIIGNINADGGTRPSSISYLPTAYSGQCQIFRNALDLTRRAMKTTLRTGPAYQEAKLDTLQDHTLEMEKAWLFSQQYTGVGDNGKPVTTTRGIIPFLKLYAADNCVDFTVDTDYTGKTWLQGGEDWLDAMIQQLFKDGNVEGRLVFCGDGALAGINRLIKATGQAPLTPRMTSWGIGVTEWHTVFGTINLKTHPLFSFEETNRYSMLAIVPQNLKYRYIDDTDFYADGQYQKGGGDGKDAISEEWLTDAGLEIHWPTMMGYFNGVGQDNTLTS